MSKPCIVITTINPPSKAVLEILRLCREDWSIVIVGDVKTPEAWHDEEVVYLDVKTQKKLFGELAEIIPYNHYSRKNLGYLYAMEQGAEFILETDDDNIPYAHFGKDIRVQVKGRILSRPGWVNIYKNFTSRSPLWPRGLPLDEIHTFEEALPLEQALECPVQQSLIDRDTDVDAIYRLVFNEHVYFDRSPSVVLSPDTRSPFNSQNVLFFSKAFPLMYLPCYVPFRMTDIWRSFVVQTVLAHYGFSMAYHASSMEQVRNPHNNLNDFEDEIAGYRYNRAMVECLEKMRRSSAAPKEDMATTGLAFWTALVNAEFLNPKELPVLKAWFARMQPVYQEKSPYSRG